MTRFSAALAALLAFALPAGAATLGTNLIVNGDAETGDTSGWVNTQGIDAITGAGEVASGTYAFTAGTGASQAQMTQTIDLSGLAGLIGTGGVTYTLGGQFQNRVLGGASDIVRFSVSFFGAGSSFITGSPQLTDPSSASGVYDYNGDSVTGAVPVSTLSAIVTLSFSRNAGASTDAYADDLSLVLNAAPAVPVPAGLPLLVGGLGALAWLRRRARTA